MKFILRVWCDNERDAHDRAVVEVDQRAAETLLRLREIFNAAGIASPVLVDEITFKGPGYMCVVAVDEDRVFLERVRKDPPTLEDDCTDPDADVNWVEGDVALDYDEAATVLDRTCVNETGVYWVTYFRYSDERLYTATVSWESIERVSRGELP